MQYTDPSQEGEHGDILREGAEVESAADMFAIFVVRLTREACVYQKSVKGASHCDGLNNEDDGG